MTINKPELECDEDECPFHGSLAVRGRTLEGLVVSTRMRKSCVVQLNYTRYDPKYERYARMRSRITAHSTPCIPIKIGDSVKIAECRPLSKTKSFVVVEILKEV